MLCLLISSGYAAAQVLTATPAFPSPTQPFTFYFDATQGNGGLADCNCEVYLHTGVITNLSTSQSDWKHSYNLGQQRPHLQNDQSKRQCVQLYHI
ncbi:MAG: hypothetical protein IPL35_07580 [Sphingobacteriales bacterium]|nr:hypothetical protein [Sphingobacteriales bacterium]